MGIWQNYSITTFRHYIKVGCQKVEGCDADINILNVKCVSRPLRPSLKHKKIIK